MLAGNGVEPRTWPRVKPIQALSVEQQGGLRAGLGERWLSMLLKRPPLLG